MPDPQEGNEWRLVEDFNAGDEILKDAGLKEVFKAAIHNGYAIIASPLPDVLDTRD